MLFAPADRWMLYRAGPFEVYSNGDDKVARETLNLLEQFRHTFGAMLGKPELDAVFPVRVTVKKGMKQPPVSREFLLNLGRTFIEENAGRMPQGMEQALAVLFSTLQVQGTHVTLGALPPEEERNRDWARLHMLSTDERFSGKLRVLLGNLQKGVAAEPACSNAFAMKPAEVESALDAYLATNRFGTAQLNGKPINAQRDFYPKPSSGPPAGIEAKEFLAQGDFVKAAIANPKWAEPVFEMARREPEALKKIDLLKKAASLAPRNAAYWRLLAELQEAQKLFPAAAQSWAAADRAAVNDQEREKFRTARLNLDQQRLDFAAAEKKRIAEEKQRELDRLRDEALAKIRAAEAKVNRPLDPGQKVEQWWDGAQPTARLKGRLERVDCLPGAVRIAVRTADRKLVQLLIRNPNKIVIEGGGDKTLGCGPQRPPRNISVGYFPKSDAKTSTSGEAALIEFPQ